MASSLINKKAVRDYALAEARGQGRILYGGRSKFTRVSSEFMEDLERAAKEWVVARIRSTPNKGCTL